MSTLEILKKASVSLVLAASLTTGALGACKPKDKGDSSAKAEDTTSSSAPTTGTAEPAGSADVKYNVTTSSAQAVEANAKKGKFVYVMDPAKKPELKTYEALFTPGSRIEVVVKAMTFVLPRDVPVVARECNRVNASYYPDKHAIAICYELAQAFHQKFLQVTQGDDEKASNLALDALTFTVLHEMGHALVGELGLGVTGGEEDAVDDLAALILIESKMSDAAISGPYALMQLTKNQPPAYFDEHSISEQRLGNVLCMIYGNSPKENERILVRSPELKPRAPKCPKEYAQKDKFWTQALAPYARK